MNLCTTTNTKRLLHSETDIFMPPHRSMRVSVQNNPLIFHSMISCLIEKA
jgi:hypothetical protein